MISLVRKQTSSSGSKTRRGSASFHLAGLAWSRVVWAEEGTRRFSFSSSSRPSQLFSCLLIPSHLSTFFFLPSFLPSVILSLYTCLLPPCTSICFPTLVYVLHDPASLPPLLAFLRQPSPSLSIMSIISKLLPLSFISRPCISSLARSRIPSTKLSILDAGLEFPVITSIYTQSFFSASFSRAGI